MKNNKQEKCWILEEVEKNNIVLDKSIEEVEEERKERDKEINKRFEKPHKDVLKVKEEDHEEKCKPHKVEESLKDRKELTAFMRKARQENPEVKIDIKKSTKEGFRYDASYVVEAYGFVKRHNGYKIIDTPHTFVITDEHGNTVAQAKTLAGAEGIIDKIIDMKGLKESLKEELPDAIPEEPLVISTEETPELIAMEEPSDEEVENAVYLALSSELRDTLLDIENLKSLVVTIIEDENQEETIETINKIIEDRTSHADALRKLLGIEEEPKEEPEVDVDDLEMDVDLLDLEEE